MNAGSADKPGLGAPEGETFVGRWSRRKRAEPVVRVHEDAAVAAEALEAQAVQAREQARALAQTNADAETTTPADLPPVESLTPDSDYTRFMQPDVPRASRNAAMKKLFTDPHFNVMDGLDTYIADYSIEDPIPESMLRELAQSKMLGLFDEKKEDEGPCAAIEANSDTETAVNSDAEVPSVEPAPGPVPENTAQPYNPPVPKTTA